MSSADPWDHTDWRALARASPRTTRQTHTTSSGAYSSSASAASYHVAHAQSHAHCDAGTKLQRAQANKGYFPFPAKAFKPAGASRAAFPAPPPRARLSDPMLRREGSKAQQRRRALAHQKPPQRSPEWQQLEAETDAYLSQWQPQRPALWEPKHAPPPRPQPPQPPQPHRPHSAKQRSQLQQPQLMHSQSPQQQQQWQPQPPTWPPSSDDSYAAASSSLPPQHAPIFTPQNSAYVQGQFQPSPSMPPQPLQQQQQPHALATSYSSVAFPAAPSEPAQQWLHPPQVSAPSPSTQTHAGNVRTLRPASAPPARLQQSPLETPVSLRQTPQGYNSVAPASASQLPYPSHSRPSAAELLHSAARSAVPPATAAPAPPLSASSSAAAVGSHTGFGFDGGEEAWQQQSFRAASSYDYHPSQLQPQQEEEEKQQHPPTSSYDAHPPQRPAWARPSATLQPPPLPRMLQPQQDPPLSAHEQQYTAQLYARRPRPVQAASTTSASALGARTGTGGGARAGSAGRSRRGGRGSNVNSAASSSSAVASTATPDEDVWSSLYLSRLLSKAESGQAEAGFFARSSAVLRKQAANPSVLYAPAARSARRTGWWQPPPNSELLSSVPSAEAARAPTAWLQPTPLPAQMQEQEELQVRRESGRTGQTFVPTESEKVWAEIQEWRAKEQQQQQQQRQQSQWIASAPPPQPHPPIYSPLQLSDEAASAMFAQSSDDRADDSGSVSNSASPSAASSPSSTPRATHAPPASVPPLHMDRLFSPER